MNELRYQVDLLTAMNQKLSVQEKMYRLVCDTSYNAFLYYSFEKSEISLLGKWDSFFDFRIRDWKDLGRLYEMVDEPYVDTLRDVIFLEKKHRQEAVTECMLRDKRAWLEFRARVFYDEEGVPQDKIISVSDITKFKQQNEELTYMAYYDSLTGLYNRNYFVRLLTEYVRRAQEEREIVSVLLIDIDDFRKVNDGLGIIVGDELVQQLGSFLKEMSCEDIIVCHLNSDIYCMAIYDPTGPKSVTKIHERIQERMRKPFLLSGGQEIGITVSVGVAEYPESAATALELIGCAEIVMYKSKDMGKNTIQYFDTPILNEFLQNVQIENQLKDAIYGNNSFELYYQPQYYSGNKQLRGMEALIRWRDGSGRMISPAVFIPIAEQNGAIVSIGRWVMEESIRQFAEWRSRWDKPLVLSINVSAIQYMKDGFVDELLQVLSTYQVPAGEVELEITESVLIEDFNKVTAKLRVLRDYGIRVSLDDFGTGFSSLSYLKKLPINTLKIDKSFIDTVLSDAATRIITESIISMVHTLGLETIAEGVEQEQQYKYLHAIGCNIIQGYYFGRPLPVQEMEMLLEQMGENFG
ncbi:MAG: bifunctional diguanylate cyclase/phosphodiesterase [Acetatifactor sp.]|nr:bifunctional diguanylate cyclase/phosphodiesterase [Acetatifactor sp.]